MQIDPAQAQAELNSVLMLGTLGQMGAEIEQMRGAQPLHGYDMLGNALAPQYTSGVLPLKLTNDAGGSGDE